MRGRVHFKIIIWTCKKCGMTIQSESKLSPSSMGCPKGGGHSWTKTICH